MRYLRHLPPAALVALIAGCATDRDTMGADDGLTSVGEDTDTGDAPGDAGDGDPTDGIKFDTPEGMPGGDGEGGGEEGCTKVDFLFVVDNSGSMDDDQANLIENFPGFMQAIQETLEVEDFHVMVVDTDTAGTTNPDCYDWWDQNDDPWHLMPCPYTPIPSGAPEDMLPLVEDCDGILGAGVDMPLGVSATNQECSFASGKRYMDSSEPDLPGAFACAARVGIAGSNGERQAQALTAAIGPEQLGPGACNEGFLRSDALLVITILTDEDDESSEPEDDPQAWAQAIVDAKGGKEENVVILGLLSEWGGPLLEALVHSFSHGQVESVSIPDYRPFFEAAVGEIDGACDAFVPPG